MDPMQWMGAVRMRVQTPDKKHHNNPQLIHSTPTHKLMSWEAKICMFVGNKSIIKMFLTLNYRVWLKYESSIHNIAFSREKVTWLESREKYAPIKHWLQVKTVSLKQSKTNIWLDSNVRGQQVIVFFTGESVIMDYGLIFWQ